MLVILAVIGISMSKLTDHSIGDQAKTKLILAFIERVENLSEKLDSLVMAEGFDKPLKTLIEGWVKDAKLYCQHNECGVALDLLLENLYEVDFNIDYPTARLALMAAYSFEPLNQTWIQIINELSKNQPIDDTPAIVKQQEQARELVHQQPQYKSATSEEVEPAELETENIIFSKDGTILLHSFKEKVSVWDVRNNQLRYQVFGTLIGISHRHNTFQTTVGTWSINTGDAIESPPVLHDWDKRLKVSGRSIKDKFYLEVIDKSGIREPQLVHVGGSSGIVRAGHKVDRNGRYVTAYFYINIMGHDLDQTICYDLETGQDVYSFIDDYDVSFSEIHNLLIAKNTLNSSLTVCDLATKQKLELEKVGRSIDEHTVRINPKNTEFTAALNKKRNVIFLGRINQILQRKMIRETKQKILDIDFNPDGTHLAASLSDGDVHIWDVNNYQLIQRLSEN